MAKPLNDIVGPLNLPNRSDSETFFPRRCGTVFSQVRPYSIEMTSAVFGTYYTQRTPALVTNQTARTMYCIRSERTRDSADLVDILGRFYE